MVFIELCEKNMKKKNTDPMTKMVRVFLTHAQYDQVKAAAVTIPAVVERYQQIMNGMTLSMRLTCAVRVNGVILPQGQQVNGVATINNDRIQVTIHSVRHEQSILSMNWQVYDMDGLPASMSRMR